MNWKKLATGQFRLWTDKYFPQIPELNEANQNSSHPSFNQAGQWTPKASNLKHLPPYCFLTRMHKTPPSTAEKNIKLRAIDQISPSTKIWGTSIVESPHSREVSPISMKKCSMTVDDASLAKTWNLYLPFRHLDSLDKHCFPWIELNITSHFVHSSTNCPCLSNRGDMKAQLTRLQHDYNYHFPTSLFELLSYLMSLNIQPMILIKCSHKWGLSFILDYFLPTPGTALFYPYLQSLLTYPILSNLSKSR